VRRDLLDFDFEKVCSISLSNINVYACLVCGKYYQGRGKDTYAYTHSLEQEHHIFINLSDQKIYCLPDNYEIHDNSLNDIKFNLKPSFTNDEVEELDKLVTYSRALDGTDFLPGSIGLNNIKKTDYVNVIIQSLCRINSLRNFMLEYDDSDDIVIYIIILEIRVERSTFPEICRVNKKDLELEEFQRTCFSS
jgi:U4/U6.U5 tri-snRNP-associated protein 2